jgi:hypothetical protein
MADDSDRRNSPSREERSSDGHGVPGKIKRSQCRPTPGPRADRGVECRRSRDEQLRLTGLDVARCYRPGYSGAATFKGPFVGLVRQCSTDATPRQQGWLLDMTASAWQACSQSKRVEIIRALFWTQRLIYRNAVVIRPDSHCSRDIRVLGAGNLPRRGPPPPAALRGTIASPVRNSSRQSARDEHAHTAVPRSRALEPLPCQARVQAWVRSRTFRCRSRGSRSGFAERD